MRKVNDRFNMLTDNLAFYSDSLKGNFKNFKQILLLQFVKRKMASRKEKLAQQLQSFNAKIGEIKSSLEQQRTVGLPPGFSPGERKPDQDRYRPGRDRDAGFFFVL